MKLTFPLAQPEADLPRVVATLTQKIRKYVKRERRKPFPEGYDCWEFDCRLGVGDAPPSVVPVDALVPAIAAAAAGGALRVFVEIIARAGLRPPRPNRSSAGSIPSELRQERSANHLPAQSEDSPRLLG